MSVRLTKKKKQQIKKQQKNKTKKKSKSKKLELSLTSEGLTLRQEKFCQNYVSSDKELFGNGTRSYIEAYGYTDEEGNRIFNYASVMVCASRLLRNVKVTNRINQLLETGGFTAENVDKQHLFLINQHSDFKTKLGAIKEFNLLKKRVDNKIEVNIYTPTAEERKKAAEAVTKFLNKK